MGASQEAAEVLPKRDGREGAGEPGGGEGEVAGEVKGRWEGGEGPGRRPVKMHRKEFYERVKAEAGLASLRESRWYTVAGFTALKEQLSPGGAGGGQAQLPKDLKEVWEEA